MHGVRRDALTLLLAASVVARAETQTRGPRPATGKAKPAAASPHDTQFDALELGRYHALMIGIQYDGNPHPALRTPVRDVRKIGRVLADAYGFDVRYLTEARATRSGILLELERYARELDDGDNLLIYYAGHGDIAFRHENGRYREGFWIPHGAGKSWPDWISGGRLRRMLKMIRARHILTISDACFGGTAFSATRGSTMSPLQKRFVLRPSCQFLTSGSFSSVPDSDASGEHSPFARRVLEFLSDPGEGQRHWLACHLHAYLQRRAANENVVPSFGDVPGDDRDQGQFVFKLLHAERVSVRAPIVHVEGLPAGFRQPPRLTIEKRGQGYRYTSWLGRKRRVHSELVPVVPGPLQLPGEDSPRHVKPFLIDRFEVTYGQFLLFCEETGHTAAGTQPVRARVAERAIVGVSIQDARAFARWAGKQLPTDREWLAAAGGHDGGPHLRTFAWGDEFDPKRVARKLHKLPPLVGGRIDDASFWNAIGMSSGIREWCELTPRQEEYGSIYGGCQVQRWSRERWCRDDRHARLMLQPRRERDANGRELATRNKPAGTHAAYIGFRCILRLQDR